MSHRKFPILFSFRTPTWKNKSIFIAIPDEQWKKTAPRLFRVYREFKSYTAIFGDYNKTPIIRIPIKKKTSKNISWKVWGRCFFVSWLTCFFPSRKNPHGKSTSDRSSSGKRHVDPNLQDADILWSKVRIGGGSGRHFLWFCFCF